MNLGLGFQGVCYFHFFVLFTSLREAVRLCRRKDTTSMFLFRDSLVGGLFCKESGWLNGFFKIERYNYYCDCPFRVLDFVGSSIASLLAHLHLR